MPAWMRKIQQSHYFHVLVMPAVILFAVSVWNCAGEDMVFTALCAKHALHEAITPIVIYLGAIYARKPGSDRYLPDGSTNEVVVQAAQIGKDSPRAAAMLADPETASNILTGKAP